MSKIAKAFIELFATGRDRLEYFVHGAIIEFTEAVVARMEELDLSKSDLAQRLNCKPSYITKVLRGPTNFTLESMVKIASALDSEITINLRPKFGTAKWGRILRIQIEKPVLKTALLDWAAPRGSFTRFVPGTKSKNYPDESAFALAA